VNNPLRVGSTVLRQVLGATGKVPPLVISAAIAALVFGAIGINLAALRVLTPPAKTPVVVQVQAKPPGSSPLESTTPSTSGADSTTTSTAQPTTTTTSIQPVLTNSSGSTGSGSQAQFTNSNPNSSPPTNVPEVGLTLALPLSAAAVLVGVFYRRKRRSATVHL